ncbi:MAG: hypothetical protein JRF33_21030 [Deltaproteobacteria bacterium]|nr:hypothetical protein [Deltaproteobacteria bacterium]
MQRSRIRRLLMMLLKVLGGVMLALVAAVMVLGLSLGRLDHPSVKGPIKSYLQREMGLSLDWAVFSISPMSGLRLSGFHLDSAPADRALAPRLAELGALEVDWSLGGLMADTPRIDRFKLEGLKLAVVRDAHGKTSLDRLFPPAEEPATDPTPEPEADVDEGLSKLFQKFKAPIVLGQVELGAVELVFFERAEDLRWHLTTPAVSASLEESEMGSLPDLKLDLGEDGKDGVGGRLRLIKEQAGETKTLELAIRQSLKRHGDKELVFELGLELLRQELLTELPPGPEPLLKLKGQVIFLAQEGLVELKISNLDLLGGGLKGSLLARLPDEGSGPLLKSLAFSLNGGPLLRWLPKGLIELEAKDLSGELEIHDMGLDLKAGLPNSGRIQSRFSCASLSLLQFEVLGLKASTELNLSGEEAPKITAKLDLQSFALPGSRIDGLSLMLDAGELKLDLQHPMDTGAKLSVKTQLAKVRHALGGEDLILEDLGLEMTLEREQAGPILLSVKLPVAAVKLGSGISLEGLALKLDAQDLSLNLRGPAKAQIELDLDKIRLRKPGLSASLDSTGLRLDLKDLHLEEGKPHARVQAKLELRRLHAKVGTLLAQARKVGFEVETATEGAIPRQVDWRLPLGYLKLEQDGKKGRSLLAELTRAKLAGQISELALNQLSPERSSAKLKLQLQAHSLGLADGRSLRLKPSRLSLFVRAGRRVGGDGRIFLSDVSMGKRLLPGDWNLDFKLAADRGAPSLELQASAKGSKGLDVQVKLLAAYQAARKKLMWRADLGLSKLSLLQGLLPPDLLGAWALDWRSVKLDATSQGEFLGLIERFDRQGLPRFAEDPFAAVGRAHLQLDARALNLSDAAASAGLQLPRLSLRADLDKKGKLWTLSQVLDVERLGWLKGRDSAELSGLVQTIKMTAKGAPERSRIGFQGQVKLAKLRQSFVAGYPVGDLDFSILGRLDALQALRIEKIELSNPAAGTRLNMELALDRIARLAEVGKVAHSGMPGRQALRLSGTFEQDLSKLDLKAQGIEAKGMLRMPIEVQSGDMKAYRVATQIQAEGLHIKMPSAKLEVVGLDGRIPIIEDLALKPGGGIALASQGKDNLYSQARFSDVHPFLRGQNYIALDELKIMGHSMGPLAGNLRIEQQRISLDQLQLGLRGGKITGQLRIDADPVNPHLFFKGNVTGLRPSGGKDVLDANATLSLAPAKLDLSGRIQVVRIGSRHLLDVLDLLDPYRENVGINRVRLGLKVGYPKFLRLRMREGFLDAKVELGGAVDFVRIDEIKGVALGPLLNRFVAPQMRALGLGAVAPSSPGASAGDPGLRSMDSRQKPSGMTGVEASGLDGDEASGPDDVEKPDDLDKPVAEEGEK